MCASTYSQKPPQTISPLPPRSMHTSTIYSMHVIVDVPINTTPGNYSFDICCKAQALPCFKFVDNSRYVMNGIETQKCGTATQWINKQSYQWECVTPKRYKEGASYRRHVIDNSSKKANYTLKHEAIMCEHSDLNLQRASNSTNLYVAAVSLVYDYEFHPRSHKRSQFLLQRTSLLTPANLLAKENRSHATTGVAVEILHVQRTRSGINQQH